MRRQERPFTEIKLTYIAGIFAIIVLLLAGALLSGTGLVTQEVIVGQDQQPPVSGGQQPASNPTCGTPCWLTNEGEQPGTFESAQGKAGVLGLDGKCYSPQKYAADLRCCASVECPGSKPTCSTIGVCQ